MVLSSVSRWQVAEPPSLSSAPIFSLPSHEPSWDQSFISTLNQIFLAGTEPELLLGMGLGPLASGGGRLLAFEGARSAGLAGRVALWAGRVGGVLAEGAAWTATTQTGRWLQGGAMGREWLETSALAGSLRSAQWAFGKGGPWGLALGGFAGLVLSGQALSLVKSNHVLPWRDSLNQSAVLFASFSAGGTLAQILWGSTLARMDRIFLGKLQQIQAVVENSAPGYSEECWAMTGDSGSGGPAGKSRRPFSSHPEIREIGLEKTGALERPWQFDHLDSLLDQMRNLKSPFREKIREVHLNFLLGTREGYLREKLNRALNELEYLSSLPAGRKIQIRFENDPMIEEFIKFGPTFRFRERGRTSPPENKVRVVVPASTTFSKTTVTMEGVRYRMDQVAARRPTAPAIPRPHSSKPPTRLETTEVKPVAPIPPLATPVVLSAVPLKLVSSTKEMMVHLQTLSRNSTTGFAGEIFINRTHPLEPDDLLQVHRQLVESSEGSHVDLHDPQRRRTYHFHKEGLKVRGGNTIWKEHRNFEHFEAHSLLDLLQKLSFLHSSPLPKRGSIFVEIRGSWRPWNDSEELEKFLNIQLPEPQPTIQIHQGSDKQSFQFDLAKRRWVKGRWE
jgi:hypothetical protein